MLKIKLKEGESIERALKRYKNKVRKTKQLDRIRKRKQFDKKSVIRRDTVNKSKYKNKLKIEKSN